MPKKPRMRKEMKTMAYQLILGPILLQQEQMGLQPLQTAMLHLRATLQLLLGDHWRMKLRLLLPAR